MNKRNFENKIVNKVVDWVKAEHDDEVEVLGKRIKLWRFKNLKKKLPTNFPLQPDIDILLCKGTQDRCRVTGVEVKTVYLGKDNELNVRYYKGLDEAIALLRFGLDAVVFFQVFLIPLFNFDKMLDEYLSYSMHMREIIGTLNLPIGYTPSFAFLINNELSQEPIKVMDLKDPSNYPESKQLILRNKGKNPFLSSELVYPRVIRSFLLSKFFERI